MIRHPVRLRCVRGGGFLPRRTVLWERRQIEELANPLAQGFRRKRLLEVVTQLISRTDADIVCIPRYEENPEVGLEDAQMLCQFGPAHAGHDHIGEEKLIIAYLLCGDQAGFQSVFGFQYAIAEFFEFIPDEVTHGGVVFDEEDGFTSPV